MCHVVKAWNTIHNQLNITNSIMVNRVQPSNPIQIATNCSFCLWKQLYTISVYSAECWSITVISKLRPNLEHSIDIRGLGSSSTECILLSYELVYSKDRKDCEDENDEEEYAH